MRSTANQIEEQEDKEHGCTGQSWTESWTDLSLRDGVLMNLCSTPP